jgi:hypothetical protein
MIATVLVLLLANAPIPCDIGIDVFERRRSTVTRHCVTLANKSVRQSASNPIGPAFQPINAYEIRNCRLQKGDSQIANAVEILVQARAGALDIVVIRNEYNSFSNPLRILAAIVGHPSQVSEVTALALSDGNVIGRWRLARAASSYEWRAVLRNSV